jgi:hypothetical protein
VALEKVLEEVLVPDWVLHHVEFIVDHDHIITVIMEDGMAEDIMVDVVTMVEEEIPLYS